ncbi:MAG: hypothetical protein M5U28_37710 [Sandaracinaceae bacterium]|nr:hypothetical protein [Sandaracinaceae bacterium]
MQSTRRFSTLALVALGALLGVCAARLLDITPQAAAQERVQFRECTALSLHWHDGAAFGSPAWQPRTIPIRRGWTVVGGTSAGPAPYAVVCR